MQRHRFLHYRIISMMFWSFPYLLWQASGHWIGFVVGVIVAVVLTTIFNGLFRGDDSKTVSSAERQSVQMTEPQAQHQETEPYQRGYRAEEQSYCAEAQLHPMEDLQSPDEEIEVPYPKMPPMKRQ